MYLPNTQLINNSIQGCVWVCDIPSLFSVILQFVEFNLLKVNSLFITSSSERVYTTSIKKGAILKRTFQENLLIFPARIIEKYANFT